MLNKVIKGLEHCTTDLGCKGCPYSVNNKPGAKCQLQIDKDALYILQQMSQDIAIYKAAFLFLPEWYKKGDG